MMPNRYLPSALIEVVDDEHSRMLRERDDEYVPEWEAIVEMLQPEYQEQFEQRRDG